MKGLISDMLARLQADAAADASHKAICDKEMSETTSKKEENKLEIAKLTKKTKKVEQMAAQSAQLKEEVATVRRELAVLAAMQAEMGKLRHEEKSVYDSYRLEIYRALKASRGNCRFFESITLLRTRATRLLKVAQVG